MKIQLVLLLAFLGCVAALDDTQKLRQLLEKALFKRTGQLLGKAVNKQQASNIKHTAARQIKHTAVGNQGNIKHTAVRSQDDPITTRLESDVPSLDLKELDEIPTNEDEGAENSDPSTPSLPQTVEDTTEEEEEAKPAMAQPEEGEAVPGGEGQPPKDGGKMGPDCSVIPNTMLAFVLSTRSMKVETVQAADMTSGLKAFSSVLKSVITSLRRSADDAKNAPSVDEAADKLSHDLELLSKSFQPGLKEASTLLLRTTLYGVPDKKVCDVDSDAAYGCIVDQLSNICDLARNPDHLDKNVDDLPRCQRFKRNSGEGTKALSDDIQCVANRVEMMQEIVEELTDTANEQKLASLLDTKPLPNFPGDLSGVATKVKHDLMKEVKGILALIFRLLDDITDLKEALSAEK